MRASGSRCVTDAGQARRHSLNTQQQVRAAAPGAWEDMEVQVTFVGRFPAYAPLMVHVPEMPV